MYWGEKAQIVLSVVVMVISFGLSVVFMSIMISIHLEKYFDEAGYTIIYSQ